MEILNTLPLVMLLAFIAIATPGPAVLAITGTAMAQGTRPALRLAAGVLCGSLTWSGAAALGLSAAMLAHGWIVEAVRYAGAGYMLWLAWKSARAAIEARRGAPPALTERHHFWRGLALHLTNPKAIFFFGALYAVVLTPGQSPLALLVVWVVVGLQSAVFFLGYALLFSRPGPMAFYRRAARLIHGASALLFGGFGLRLLTARLET